MPVVMDKMEAIPRNPPLEEKEKQTLHEQNSGVDKARKWSKRHISLDPCHKIHLR